MNIYLLTQAVETGYDTYDSCVVAAETEEEAKGINPYGVIYNLENPGTWGCYGWPKDTADIKTKLIGTAIEGTEAGVILASFNAG